MAGNAHISRTGNAVFRRFPGATGIIGGIVILFPKWLNSRTHELQKSELRRHLFCQYFSMKFWSPKEFDRKFRGEILKIERRNLED
jgi:hypothetical protein